MADYTAELVKENFETIDIRIIADGKTKHMWGKFGPRKEEELAAKADSASIPVLVGSGLGIAARKLAADSTRPVLILDNESSILNQTDLRSQLKKYPNIIWITTDSAVNAARHIDELSRNYQKEIQFIKIPFYQRLSPFYAHVENELNNEKQNHAQFPSWPKFQSAKPRILLLTSQYFLLGEIVAACERDNIPHMFINMDAKEMEMEQFVTRITAAITTFRPDFVLTVNHLGVDQEGVLSTLLHKFDLPLASWFVDNPMLILPLYQRQANSSTVIFTWDADRMDCLNRMGFKHIFHLPLGTDQTRFLPSKGCSEPKWKRDISFVGNSMVHKTARKLQDSRLSGQLARDWKEIAVKFGKESEPSVARFLEKEFPAHFSEFNNIASPFRRLCFETLIIWQATLEYRLSCVKQTLGHNPLLVGDDGWKTLLQNEKSWDYHKELSYYSDLPRFYPCSKINFNCTSQQMKGAVNQRVFDVPACNGFILTDHRYQMENLFEPQKEIAVYNHTEEIPELIDKYLQDSDAREKIVNAARKRILAEHTYDCRLKTLIKNMRMTCA